MRHEEQNIDDVVVLKVVGDVRIGSFQAFWSRLDELASHDRNFVLVDLAGVSRMDHPGWLRMIESRNTTRAHGGEVALCLGGGMVAETFRLADLERSITAYPSLEAGLDGISPKRRELNAVADALESLLFGNALDGSMKEESGTDEPTVAGAAGAIERILEIESSPENHLAREPQGEAGVQGKLTRWLKSLLNAKSE